MDTQDIITENTQDTTTQNNSNKKRIILISIVSVVCLAVLAVLIMVVIPTIRNESLYRKAVNYYESGMYENAKKTFYQVGDYKDAVKKYNSIRVSYNKSLSNGVVKEILTHDSNGKTTSYEKYNNGILSWKDTYTDTQDTNAFYDKSGNVTSIDIRYKNESGKTTGKLYCLNMYYCVSNQYTGYKYDSFGNVIEEEITSWNEHQSGDITDYSTTKYEYEREYDNSLCVKEIKKDDSGKTLRATLFEYDKQGNLVTETVLEDGQITYETKTKYNKNGIETKETYTNYNDDGTKYSEDSRWFDIYGNLIKIEYKKYDGNSVSETEYNYYKYNEYGLEIESSTRSSGETTIEKYEYEDMIFTYKPQN